MSAMRWDELAAEDRRQIMTEFPGEKAGEQWFRQFRWARAAGAGGQSPWRAYDERGAVVAIPPAPRQVNPGAPEEHRRKREEVAITLRISPKAGELLALLLGEHARREQEASTKVLDERSAERCLEEACEARHLAEVLGAAVEKWDKDNPPA